MSHVKVVLSEQDLSDFLEDNQDYMDAYANELHRRLADFYNGEGDTVQVEIDSNALRDVKSIDGETDIMSVDHIDSILNDMVNDWSWLPS